MTTNTVEDFLQMLTTGIWVGVFIFFVCRMIAFVIDKIIGFFKKL